MIVIGKDDQGYFNEISHILGSIHVSSYIGAAAFEGRKLCLHHDCTLVTDLHVPLLIKRPNSDTDRSGAQVNHRNLALITEIIEKHYRSNLPLCVHCKGGVERSPLAVVHWLNSRHGYDWDDAYEFVQSKRKVVEDRTIWM